MTSRQGVRRVFPKLGIGAGDAGIVDEDVDAAEGVIGFVPGGFNSGEVGEIDLNRDYLAGVREFLTGGLRQRLITVPKADLGARSQKSFSNGPAYPLGSARDHGAPAFEIDLVHDPAILDDVVFFERSTS